MPYKSKRQQRAYYATGGWKRRPKSAKRKSRKQRGKKR